MELNTDLNVHRLLLAACNTAVLFPTEEAFIDHWGRVRDAIGGIGGNH